MDLKAISSNVFVKRDAQEAEVGGIDISEGARVGSSYGTIVAIDTCDFAKVGDRVHIPHYAVQDMEIDGEELAVFKIERLFYVNGEPVNKYALVRKCANDHVRDADGEIALFMTDKHIEFTQWVEVLEVAKDCETLCNRYVGMFTNAPESNEKLARVGTTKDFCMHESLIEFLTEG